MPLAPGQSLDSLVAQVSSAGPSHTYSEIANHIRQFAHTEGGAGEVALGSTLQNGSDPLNVVDASAQTLLALYILCASLLHMEWVGS
jgi:hypothetical protein